jgi:UDP-GlcNAc:undecaprenyl-phosphate GlcNAc-1-phosphate transferase
MLISYLPGMVALLLCIAALPLVKRFARRFGLYDAPGPLKIHQGAIPRLGGIAMFAGFLGGSLAIYWRNLGAVALPLAVFAAIWAIGAIDDLRNLGAHLRFTVQIAAGCVLWFAGWRLQWFHSAALDLICTCLFVAFVVNAMNLLDGMDGLAAGTSVVMSIGFLLIADGEGNLLGVAIAASLAGACAGVLAVNAPPASMFMGDSGSTLIGIVLAFLSLNWVRGQESAHSIIVPLIFLSVPLMDAVLAIARRLRGRQSLFSGDRRHYYDILLQRGWSVSGVLRASICVTATLVFTGWLCARGIAGELFTGAMVACSLGAIASMLGSLRPDLTSVQTSQPETPIGPAIE